MQKSLGREGVAEGALTHVTAVLSGVYQANAPDMTWVGDLDAYCERIVTKAPERFNRTFDRWRTLFGAAERQAEEAHGRLRKHTLDQKERRQLEAIRGNAEKQMELLRGGSDDKQSDFYTYRYLATEGFLPGYNFPRLPLVAFVSTGAAGHRGGPRSSARASSASPSSGRTASSTTRGGAIGSAGCILKSGDQRAETGELATRSFYICENAGPPIPTHDPISATPAASRSATRAKSATPTASSRSRQCPPSVSQPTTRSAAARDLRSGRSIEWPVRDGGRRDVRQAEVIDDDGVVARLTFGPATTIRRFNVGLRRRDPKKGDGFNINPCTGYWARSADEDTNEPPDPDKVQPQQIVPYVEDRKNALLFTPEDDVDDVAMADLQYAIARGLEVVFQLEEGEVLGEALPERSDRRSILIYEAAEGGAGVLSQLVVEPGALARVMAKAIETCHFDVERFEADGELHDVADAGCVAGCYRCLLSYYNQPDHAIVDRRSGGFKRILARLARARVVRTRSPQPAPADETDPAAEPGDHFLAAIVARGLEPFDGKPIEIGGQPTPMSGARPGSSRRPKACRSRRRAFSPTRD